MSTRPIAVTGRPEEFIVLPDPPPQEDMNNWKYFNSQGNGVNLARYLGREETTLIASEAYIAPEPDSPQEGLFAPDLLIAFEVDPGVGLRRNGYVVSDFGKPPDFVLEIGSYRTGERDATVKREGYAELGVREYWRFDPSGGEYQGAALAGDRLVDGVYEPIPIEAIDDRTRRGYSAVLDVHLRWEGGQLGWYDPATGRHIPTFDDERAGRLQERAGRLEERAGRLAAEARVRELEEELRKLQ